MLPLLLALLRSSLLVSGAPFPQHRYDVPALFVFGDSFVDSGNNNFFNTSAKCNHPPYGINFEGRRSTGRWSDGLIVTDYIASFLGLPYPPNFHDKRGNFSTGANFASASAGIFNTTGLVRRRKAMIQSHELCPPLEARHPDV
ncbi:GDSL esterase/lipase At2g03980 [Selaginella moellendorffii]|uniref:GDSL esterase/lipase At2g03980 n=1 Tax=Selaginella moellendorffii TaxID=88036 RepID=UPI000D1C4CAD|nr:GDSL esterase/lipase At2g03980 [Selaginella moellendorffii]|eukprot:XP_024519626.1 GDSL esterase/lipase At2g03980 [Selaginella moellendorffii]